MTELKYNPVPHNHIEFLEVNLKRKEFKKAYEDLEEEYALAREINSTHSQIAGRRECHQRLNRESSRERFHRT